MLRSIRQFNILALALLLTACGGGGGGSDTPPSRYSISGQTSGLTGSLILSNSDDELLLIENGAFSLDLKVETGFKYDLNITQQPESQFCTLTNPSGAVTNTDITNIIIECFDINPFSISGIVSGLEGSLTLTNNNDSLVITENNQFTFSEMVETGNTYNVQISNRPATQVCSITNSSGLILDHEITDITVRCENTYSLTGTIKPAALVDIDSDINDPDSISNTNNDTFSKLTYKQANEFAYKLLTMK